jgi:hypothetical protein
MVILQRNLKTTADGTNIDIPVKLYLPVQTQGGDFKCDYEIGWPAKTRRFQAYGVDSIQSILLALQMIAIELYTSDLHKSKQLMWLKPDDGYGFPLAKGDRNLYVGADNSL